MRDLFSGDRALIGVVHLQALPGTPHNSQNPQQIAEQALAEAEILAEAGFDGIMLHVSHAALIQQFLSPWFNERDDEYGGSLEGRMRFLVESLRAAREGGGDQGIPPVGGVRPKDLQCRNNVGNCRKL